MQNIIRTSTSVTSPVTFTTDATTTGGFNLASYSGATLFVTATPNGGASTLTFLTKVGSGYDTAFTVADKTNSPVTLVVQQGRAYQLPDELFSCTWIMATCASGTVTCNVSAKG